MFLVIIKGNKFVYNIGTDGPEVNMSVLHKKIEKSIGKKVKSININYPKTILKLNPKEDVLI